ncbi:hypothetical protein SUGI_0040890 [Cryptomeria japonica]|nr:hypothetical protein SUGI_0040890 [Cryptomeria japonica]
MYTCKDTPFPSLRKPDCLWDLQVEIKAEQQGERHEVLVNEEFEGQNRREATMDSGKSDTICVHHRKMGNWKLLHTHKVVIIPWYHLGESILSGIGFLFGLVHEKLIFSLVESNPEIGNLFNEPISIYSKILVKEILAAYGDGFRKLEFRSLVDVGGKNSFIISVISHSFPNIKCCNFDLPRVISKAPSYVGLQRITGDMFVKVSNVDAIFMKV